MHAIVLLVGVAIGLVLGPLLTSLMTARAFVTPPTTDTNSKTRTPRIPPATHKFPPMKPHAHTPALVSDDVTVGVATYLMGNYFGPNAKARIVKLQARKMRKEAYKTTQILNSRWACRYGYDSFVFEYPVFDGHDASDYSHANCVVHPRRGPMIIGWAKIDAIHTLLGRGYDWVVLLAGDVWVERQEMSLGQILSFYKITQEELDRGKSVFIFESKMANEDNWPPATDKKPAGGLLNSDVILVRNTPEARDFMYVWLHYDKMPERDRDAMYYEQSILWRLTGLDETVMPKNFSFPWHRLITRRRSICFLVPQN